MNQPLSPDEHVKFCTAVGSRLSEYFKGFAIVGYHATSGERICFRQATDAEMFDALNTLLHASAIMPQVINLEPPEDGRPHE